MFFTFFFFSTHQPARPLVLIQPFQTFWTLKENLVEANKASMLWFGQVCAWTLPLVWFPPFFSLPSHPHVTRRELFSSHAGLVKEGQRVFQSGEAHFQTERAICQFICICLSLYLSFCCSLLPCSQSGLQSEWTNAYYRFRFSYSAMENCKSKRAMIMFHFRLCPS